MDGEASGAAGLDPRELALESCYLGHYAPLVRLARLLVSDPGDAEEIVQEAFVRTYANLRRVRADDPLPYVRTAVVNLARGRLRRRRVRQRIVDELTDAGGHDAADTSADVEVAFADASSADDLRAAVAALPRRQREAVVLRYLEGLTTAEAAAAMGCSDGAVKGYLHRALASLRETEVVR